MSQKPASRRRPFRSRRWPLRCQRLERRLMLTGWSDEFDDPATLVEWSRINQTEGWHADQLQLWDIDGAQAGRMVMAPHTVSWFQDWRGPLVYQEVSGDFAITTEVHVTDRDDLGGADDDDVPDEATYSLAGLMIRTPRPIANPAVDWHPGTRQVEDPVNGENYVFLSLGHGVDGRFSFEVKTTRNSYSELELTPHDLSSAEIQIARLGEAVFCLYRLPGGEWTVHRRFHRADMPETLQVGLVTYSDWDGMNHLDPFLHNGSVLEAGQFDAVIGRAYNPDLLAGFEYARFAEPQVPAELAGIDLLTEASDGDLLGFLGEHVNVPAAPAASVAARHLFYNDSVFDGDAGASPADDQAIASDKTALLPGAGPAAFAHYTSAAAGVTGVMIDVANLPAPAALDAAVDFSFRIGSDDDFAAWTPLTGMDLPEVAVRPGAGVDGSDRITLIWPAGSIVNQWVEISLLATPATGLTAGDRFYFGSAPAESTGLLDGQTQVNAADFAAVRAGPTTFLQAAAIDNPLDHNRDGRVNASDLLIVRDHATTLETALWLIAPPEELPALAMKQPAEGESAAGAAAWMAAEARRSTTASAAKATPATILPAANDHWREAARDRWFASYSGLLDRVLRR